MSKTSCNVQNGALVGYMKNTSTRSATSPSQFLPSANEVCEGYVFTPVILSTGGGGVSRPRPRGCLPRGVSRPRPRKCLPGGGVSRPRPGGFQAQGVSRPRPGGCVSQHALRQTPPPADGYCCGRYASYWNAFLLLIQLFIVR